MRMSGAGGHDHDRGDGSCRGDGPGCHERAEMPEVPEVPEVPLMPRFPGCLRAWRALQGDQLLGFVFVDEVIGKEDFITYAVGIDAHGRLAPPEVLAYRESHGGEIRNAAWRQQFAGREGLGQLRVQTDIKNIAGATLSCQHVTEGVRWLVALWQVALQPAASG